MDQFQHLREILAGRVDLPVNAHAFTEDCYRRLCRAMINQSSTGERDLAALVRHVLRHETERQGYISQTVRVPRARSWPSDVLWSEMGVEVLDDQHGTFTIQARTWIPWWLSQAGEYPPEKPVFGSKERRSFTPVPGDPFLAEMGLRSYRCAGQREAVRAVLTAPSGATLVVNLPTGAGKSLCAQLPALLTTRFTGTTVVVVPTKALAIDQERAMGRFVPHPTAYYGSSSSDQERNAEIRRRILDGTQIIVFTSPESLLKSLCRPVYRATRSGYLRMLVIDEVHIVDQWGDEFRPAFQEIAGLRKELLCVCRGSTFLTLLLSATLTESSLDTIETLFGQPGPFEVVSAVQLRPEPTYWFSPCANEENRIQRVIEAVNHLPRPLILYTTEVKHAVESKRRLKGLGYNRCEVITGKTVDLERFRIIRQWRAGETDIIVATSAFGLGVDQADVRAVVHACVPENVDRYYQEVGRGGRDGRASLSLVLYTEADLETAKSLNRKRLISVERGLERWKSMFTQKRRLPSGRYGVPVNVPPGTDLGDIDMDSDANLAWNIRTLTLMCRAGLIELDAELPQHATGDNQDREVEVDLQNLRIVKIRNERHLDQETWNSLVEPVRVRANKLARYSGRLMDKLLAGHQCVAETFASMYSIQGRENPTPRRRVVPSLGCGGCQYCREQGIAPYVGEMPVPFPVWAPSGAVGEGLSRLLGEGNILAIFYETAERDSARQRRRRDTVLRWLVAQGIRNLVAPPKLLEQLDESIYRIPGAFVFFFSEFQPVFMPRAPSLIIQSAQTPILAQMYRRSDTYLSPRVLFLPVDAVDPHKSHCRLIDTIPCRTYRFDEFCAEVGL